MVYIVYVTIAAALRAWVLSEAQAGKRNIYRAHTPRSAHEMPTQRLYRRLLRLLVVGVSHGVSVDADVVLTLGDLLD